jgi:hypothetical protein
VAERTQFLASPKLFQSNGLSAESPANWPAEGTQFRQSRPSGSRSPGFASFEFRSFRRSTSECRPPRSALSERPVVIQKMQSVPASVPTHVPV